MEKKICKKCGIEKDLTGYTLRTDTKKYRNDCNQCRKENQQSKLVEKRKSPEYRKKEAERLAAYRDSFPEERKRLVREQCIKQQQSKRDAISAAFVAEHGYTKKEARQMKLFDDFITHCTKIHDGRYSYEEVNFKRLNENVKIFCKTCSDYFIQSANNHKRGQGCKICGFISTGNKLRSSCEDFKQKVIALFGDKYDLSKVEYVNNITKVTIGCSSHGDFKIRPANLLSGRGCPYCAKHGFQKNKSGNLYVLQYGNMTKVGITNNSVVYRVKQINHSSDKSFIIVHQLHLDNGEELFSLEQQLLSLLSSSYKQPTEIFDGYTECFYDVNIEDLLSKIGQHKGTTWKTTM